MAAPTFEQQTVLALVVVASPHPGAVGRTLLLERNTLVVLGRTRDEHTATSSIGKATQRRLEQEDQRLLGAVVTHADPPLSPMDTFARADDFNISDDAVSQTHAIVFCDGAHVVVVDVQSRNGTWHNGERMSVATVVAGDVLRVGETRLEARDIDR